MAQQAHIDPYNTVRGTDGKVILEVDGNRYDMFILKSFETTASVDVIDINTIGYRNTQHKIGNISFEGSMTAYYGDPTILNMYAQYMQGGTRPKVFLTVTNQDPDNQQGSQTLRLNNVIISEFPVATLNAEEAALEAEFSFTFDSIDIKTPFGWQPGVRL